MTAPTKTQKKPVYVEDPIIEEIYRGIDIKSTENAFDGIIRALGVRWGYRYEQIFPKDGTLSPIIRTVVQVEKCLSSVPVVNQGKVLKERVFSQVMIWIIHVLDRFGMEHKMVLTHRIHTGNQVVPKGKRYGSLREERQLARGTVVLRVTQLVKLLNPRDTEFSADVPPRETYRGDTKGGFIRLGLKTLLKRELDKEVIAGTTTSGESVTPYKGEDISSKRDTFRIKLRGNQYLLGEYAAQDNPLVEIPLDKKTFAALREKDRYAYLLGQWIQSPERWSPDTFLEKMRTEKIRVEHFVKFCLGKKPNYRWQYGNVDFSQSRYYLNRVIVLVENYKTKAWRKMQLLQEPCYSPERRAGFLRKLSVYRVRLERMNQEGNKIYQLLLGVLNIERDEREIKYLEHFNWPKITRENQEYLRKMASLTTH